MKQTFSNLLITAISFAALSRLMALGVSFALIQTLIVCPAAIRAQQLKPAGDLNDPKELEAFLDPIFAEQLKKLHIPGAAIAIVKDGKIFFAKGYGVADIEKKTPVVADKTIFRIGSITKVFTATALVQTAERKKIKLGDDVDKYLKDFKIPSVFPQPVTFANLLTHTAGFDEINVGRKTTSADKVLPLGEFLKTRLVRRKPPGEFISYSTYGISLAGHLVETISGTPLDKYLSKNIFEPLEMSRTSLGAIPANLQSDLAVGYDYSALGGYRPLAFEYFHTFPASDINGTATDMGRFMLAHLEGGRYGKGRILSVRAVQEMRERHFTNHPRLLGFTYGFFENRQNGLPAIEHSGVMDGFSALMYLAPEKRFGIYVACNRETSGLQNIIKAKILDRYFPPQNKPDANRQKEPIKNDLQRFAGTYRADIYCHTCKEGERGYVPQAFEIKPNDDGTISFWGGKWKQIEPLLFELTGGQLDNGETLIAFSEDKNGQIVNMFNGTWTHEKLSNETARQPVTIELDSRIYERYTGRYEIARSQFITITREGGRLFGELTGQPKAELFPTSETRFVVKDADAEINFIKDAQNRVTDLILRLSGKEMRARKIE